MSFVYVVFSCDTFVLLLASEPAKPSRVGAFGVLCAAFVRCYCLLGWRFVLLRGWCWFVIVLVDVVFVLLWLFVRGVWFFHDGFVVVVEADHCVGRDPFLVHSIFFFFSFFGFSDPLGLSSLGGDLADLCFVESLFEWS